MKRIYFLLPNVKMCRTIVDELQAGGIIERHLHVIANLDQPLDDLPEATIWQKSEIKHGIEAGIGLGGVAGFLGGLLAVTLPPAGLILGGGTALLASSLAGAGFGGLVTALMTSHEHNHGMESFEKDIRNGKILLLIDIPAENVEKTKKMILQHHPEAIIGVAH